MSNDPQAQSRRKTLVAPTAAAGGVATAGAPVRAEAVRAGFDYRHRL